MVLKTKSIKEALPELRQLIHDRHHGKWTSVQTRWKNLNRLTFDGLMWGWIVAIAGESGIGKTTFLDNIEEDILKTPDVSLLKFNFEMSSDNLLMKGLSRDTGKTVKDLYGFGINGVGYDKFNTLIDPFEKQMLTKDVYYAEQSGTPDDIYSTAIDFIKTHQLRERSRKFVMSIDHAILVEMSKLVEGQKELMNALKKIVQFYKYSIILLVTQYNRDILSTERASTISSKLIHHYPMFSDIYGSESVRQGCDLAILFQSPSKRGITSYGPEKWDVYSKDNLPYLYAHLKKVRYSDPDTVIRFETKLSTNQLYEDDWIGYESSNREGGIFGIRDDMDLISNKQLINMGTEFNDLPF